MRVNLARFKAQGWPFEVAWDRAWRSIRWPDKREPKEEWKSVIRGGRTLWQSAYNDEGTPIDVHRLVDALSRETDRVDDDDAVALAA